jgi:hypothetical protein
MEAADESVREFEGSRLRCEARNKLKTIWESNRAIDRAAKDLPLDLSHARPDGIPPFDRPHELNDLYYRERNQA